jgi:hypothetical protein
MGPSLQRRPDALKRGMRAICAEAKRPRRRRAPPPTRWALWFALASLWALTSLGTAATPPSIEYRVKAVALLNFTKFTQWPAASFATPKAPLIIGICGDDPFGSALQEAIAGETVNGRPLEIRSVSSDSPIQDCHLLFISRSETARLKRVQELVAGKPILTISELDGFRDSGGMIQFVLHENRVRFDINRAAALQSGLVFSSRLLGVARSVTGK